MPRRQHSHIALWAALRASPKLASESPEISVPFAFVNVLRFCWARCARAARNVTTSPKSLAQTMHTMSGELSASEFPPIWDLLAKQGIRTGVFGSLHSYPFPASLDNYDFYFPDAFAAGSECFPANLNKFQELNLSMSRESARNVSRSIPIKNAPNFLSSLPDLGIRLGTLAQGAKQVLSESVDRSKVCLRRTYQVVLAFDIFMKQLQRTRPAFPRFSPITWHLRCIDFGQRLFLTSMS
jgi:hypothetical protein